MIRSLVRGRGFFAPALFARPKALLGRLVRASGGYALLGAGVVVAAVVVVSLLTFLAPDSDRPLIGRPIGAVQSVLPEALEQVEDRVVQVATLLGVDEESIQNAGENMRAGLAAARSGLSGAWGPTPESSPAAGTAPTTPPASGGSSSYSPPATDEPSSPPQTASEPSTPSSGGDGTGETSSPAPPPAPEAPSPTTSGPTTSPPATEEEVPPVMEEEPPPVVEEPPAAPPTTGEPPSPPPDEPEPPSVEEAPPATDQPEA